MHKLQTRKKIVRIDGLPLFKKKKKKKMRKALKIKVTNTMRMRGEMIELFKILHGSRDDKAALILKLRSV